LDRLSAVVRFANDFDIASGIEKEFKTFSKDRMVVNDEDFYAGFLAHSFPGILVLIALSLKS